LAEPAFCLMVVRMQTVTELQVHKRQLTKTRLHHAALPSLAPGQVRLQIDRFALTSNNITYAAFGDAMQYWQFFPVEAGADAADWGRIPVWGFATVVESLHAEVPVGERVYGYFPMASGVDLTPGKVNAQGWSDVAPHRAALHAVYNQYTRCATDPFYTADSEDPQALLRPLFITSWLIDDFLADNDWFGVSAQAGRKPLILLSSASSKTAYGTAFALAQRSGLEVVGFTSERNVAFCESLGVYHRVLTYAQLPELAADAPAIYVDFAGNAAFRKSVHTHCTGLVYSSSIGGTHVDALGSGNNLPGPRPTLFFAPAQIKKRSGEWGGAELGRRLVGSWQAFLARATNAESPWLTVEHHMGPAAVQAAYAQVLAGNGDPRVGHMLSI
jgi:hypothetical protein